MMSEPKESLIEVPSLETQMFHLSNGLELLVHEDHSAPVASVQAWVRTGAIHEGRFLGAGISHFVEHMLFKGTEKRSSNQIAQQVQNVGGYINAYTSFDRTVYWMDLPSKGVPVALELLSDALFCSVIPEEEYAKEQEVIRREFAMGFDDPDRVLQYRALATAFRIHPYRHPVIGHLEVFNALKRDDLFAYYKERYVPNNMFFVVSGDVRATQVREMLAGWVEKFPRRALAPVHIPQEPPQLGRREFHEQFATELSRSSMMWHVPELTHPDVPALDLLASIFGQGRSSRLYRRLRETDGIVHSVGAWNYTPAERGVFGVDALYDPQKRARIEQTVWEELQKLREGGVRTKELEKVQRMALSSQISGLMTAGGKASEIGSNWMVSGNPNLSLHYMALLQKVKPEDIVRVASEYLVADRTSVVTLNPKGAADAAPAAERVTQRGEIRRRTLSNGLRTLVCEDDRLPMVTVVAAFKGGLAAESPANNGISKLMSRVLIKGTEKMSAEQIAEEIESMGGSLGADAGNNTISLSMKLLRSDLPRGMEILGDILRSASFPDAVVKREKEVQLAAIKEEEEEPVAVTRRLMRATLMAGHPYGMQSLGTAQSLESLQRKDLAEWKDRLLVAANAVVSVFGDAEVDQVHALLEQHLGALPKGTEALQSLPAFSELTAHGEIEEHMDKQQAVLMVAYRGADLYSPDRAALDLLDEACSDLGSRMFIRIREQLGLAYFVGSSQFVGLNGGAFTFYLGTDPMKRTAVLAELRDEIRELATKGLSEEELARAKEKFLGSMDIRNQSLDAFAGECTVNELLGLGAEHYRVVRERISQTTLEGCLEVANRYFAKPFAVTVTVSPS
jgi:zinc protease